MSHHYHACDQYSDEWNKLRLGIPTASSFDKIVTPKGESTKGATRAKYKYRLVAERLLRQAMDDHHETYWMRRGSELEEQAHEGLKKYLRISARIEKVGFYTALDGRVGASPDGLLAESLTHGIEGVEIKCPAPYTQVGYLIDGPGDEYKAQVQGQLFVCQWKRMHFWSWHPAMPPVYIVSYRDNDFIAKMAKALAEFCVEVDDAEAYCRGLGTYQLAEKLRLSEEMAADEGSVGTPFDIPAFLPS